MSTSSSKAWSFEDPRLAERWLVRVGDDVVGPVSLDQIERGLAAGKVPLDADMAHINHRQWCPVADLVPLSRRHEDGRRRISGVQPTFVGQAMAATDSHSPQGRDSQAPDPQVPDAQPSYPEDSIEIPTHGWLRSLFG